MINAALCRPLPDPPLPPTKPTATTIISVSPSTRKKPPSQPAPTQKPEPSISVITKSGKRQKCTTTPAPNIRHICRLHTTTHTVQEIPDATNHRYDQRLLVHEDTALPGAGEGLYTTEALTCGQIVGIYENYTDGKRVTTSRVRDPTNTSLYAVEYNGIYRDAWNPKSRAVCCLPAKINDPLDASRDNATFGTHASYPARLLVVTTKPVDLKDNGHFAEAPIYMPYGGYYLSLIHI